MQIFLKEVGFTAPRPKLCGCDVVMHQPERLKLCSELVLKQFKSYLASLIFIV